MDGEENKDEEKPEHEATKPDAPALELPEDLNLDGGDKEGGQNSDSEPENDEGPEEVGDDDVERGGGEKEEDGIISFRL